jgi:hypothetical protein
MRIARSMGIVLSVVIDRSVSFLWIDRATLRSGQ